MPVPPARPSSAKKRAARPTEVPYAAWAVGIAVLAATTMAICSQPMAAQVMKAAIEAVVSNRPLTYKRGPATPLHFAAQRGELKTARELLDTGAVVVDAATNLGATPLHVAAEQGHLAMASLLLEAKASHAAVTDAGLQPLHFAAENGHGPIVRLLLDRRAAASAQTSSGHTPLHVCAASQKASPAMLLSAARVLLTHAAGALASIDAPTLLGFTALHLAALKGHEEMVQLLLASGASADVPTATGHTALHVAAEKGQSGVVELLLGRGRATLEARSHMGHTPLSIALDAGAYGTARELLRRGADPSTCDHRGVTPLHLAARRGATEMVTTLLRAHVPVDALNAAGLSPLTVAVYGAHGAGGAPIAGGTIRTDGAPTADPKLTSLLDPTPLLVALLDAGASAHAPHPWTGQTALHAAAYLGRLSWMELMLKRARSGGISGRGGEGGEGGEGGADSSAGSPSDAQHDAVDEYHMHIQRGDGLEQRARTTGRLALASPQHLARVRAAACEWGLITPASTPASVRPYTPSRVV